MSKPKGQRKQYISNGERQSVNQKVLNAMRKAISSADKWLELKRQWERGNNPWLTIANPNKAETNKRFIKVRANDHWGSPKSHFNQKFIMKSMMLGGADA